MDKSWGIFVSFTQLLLVARNRMTLEANISYDPTDHLEVDGKIRINGVIDARSYAFTRADETRITASVTDVDCALAVLDASVAEVVRLFASVTIPLFRHADGVI